VNAFLQIKLPWTTRNRAPIPSDLLRPAQFSALCAPIQSDLLRLARRLTRGNEDHAQDLVQESLVRGFETFLSGEYSEQGNLKAYLMRILTNLFLSELRRKKFDAGIDADTLTELPQPHSEIVPGACLFQQTLDEPLEWALAALPDALRATVLLVDVEGLEYTEAARALEVPIGTVRSRLFRARKMLYNALQTHAVENGWCSGKAPKH
jgi:RNA polymerase sigma-70 factor, ECF subfamily